ncbi:class I SAM-dependent methyltransferase [Clostridium estertheticum]|uniref:class I SAM-dependent methyltransferase n=1 Tax=Clostridium estertheticum TaxID=238834 RepID=UPI001C7DD416|nr:class I SAM-dependent methyltransferase [Clostridium estertheticum]MBX4265489.1 class I SAM-dependent methyltransferase [Clostridium estertheticum]WLC91163.1 class I SAM-dependent methyltransferase [Clostridium estertheticum]
MVKQKLSGVPETLLIPLWARAIETKKSNPIIKDYKAVEMMDSIDYDFSKFDNTWMSQVGVAVRTELLDNATKTFINKHPNAVVINIGCGLDTRFFRLDNNEIRWYELDLPEPIRIKKQFFSETERYKMIAKSVLDYSWINEIHVSNKPILIIVEGLLMYFTEQEVKSLINKLVTIFPNAEMLFEMMSPTLVKRSKQHDTASKVGVDFKWGIKNGKEMLKYNKKIQFIAEWNYFDYHKDRWRWLRWVVLIPALKNCFSNRIVNLRFS